MNGAEARFKLFFVAFSYRVTSYTIFSTVATSYFILTLELKMGLSLTITMGE